MGPYLANLTRFSVGYRSMNACWES